MWIVTFIKPVPKITSFSERTKTTHSSDFFETDVRKLRVPQYVLISNGPISKTSKISGFLKQ